MNKKSKGKRLVKPEFKVEYIPKPVNYNPLFDKNLQYYFTSKQNRSILRKNRILNKRNQIIDQQMIKIASKGKQTCNNFRIKDKSLSYKNQKKVCSQLNNNRNTDNAIWFGKNREFETVQHRQKQAIQMLKNNTEVLKPKTHQYKTRKHKHGLYKTMEMEQKFESEENSKSQQQPKIVEKEVFQSYLFEQKKRIESLIQGKTQSRDLPSIQ